MSQRKELIFAPIDFEEQKKKQPESLNYETTVMENRDGKSVYPDDETGFMFHQYSQFAPKEIKKNDKVIASYKPSQRNYIKINLDSQQESCVELKEQINSYDDSLAENRQIIFGKFDKLYTHVRSVKQPKEADDLDGVDPDAKPKEKMESVKMRLEMGWNYYLDGVVLDDSNSAIAKNAFFTARKEKKDPKNVLVKLSFTDEEGNETIREVKFADPKETDKTGKIVQEKDKILTMVTYRRPDSIPTDAKEVSKCTEEELVKYYGKPEHVKINTSDDLDKYYRGGCHIRLVYKPLKVYAQRNKNAEGKRNCSYIFELKLIDIINTKQKITSSETNKQYENYKFGRKNAPASSYVNEESESNTNSSSSKRTAQVIVDLEQEDEVIDGEEQEEVEEQNDDNDESEVQEDNEEEPAVVTKSTKGRTSKVMVEESTVSKSKVVSAKKK
jgi:hypothetical protein